KHCFCFGAFRCLPMRHTGGLPRRDQYGRSTEDLWSRSPFLDSFRLATNRPWEGRLCGRERYRDVSTVVVHMRLSSAFSFSRTLSRTFLPTAMSVVKSKT